MLVWKAYSRMINTLAFSPDGRTLAVGGYRLACRLIDATTGERRWTLSGALPFGLSLAFLSDGCMLCNSGPMSVVDARTGTALRNCGSWCRAFGPSPCGGFAFVADGSYLDLIHRYNLQNGRACG